ncbi:hypothetical protein QFZ56_002641 [Streptomyces achromogenes]|uniref:Uncharacterized protein n=1 Tax=Streptomyces achromogenes TaxID=67255 RepID=A0ABU0PZ35_STRAH|nr:hypothetical protein [Streptomyces achromogenes]MDQ0683678.1 hypothetical protein [Streptomyces achromogenes]
MGWGTWSWIVPDGLWEIAKPLIPPFATLSLLGVSICFGIWTTEI